MITEMDVNRFVTHSLSDPRILRVMAAAIDAVDPYRAVQSCLPHLKGRVFGLGLGKAALPMMDALAELVPLSGGLSVTKFASGPSRKLYTVIEGGHPIPDTHSLYAGERVLDFVSSLSEKDTLVCLISGGGSALVTVPYVPLEDLQTLTSLLLFSGTHIDEINILRRQLDRIKGGGVARATKAKVVSLILSDVIGNPLATIASGPTFPDPTTKEDAIAILEKYDIKKRTPASVLEVLEAESPLSSDGNIFRHQDVEHIIIGDNKLAAQAAMTQAQKEGFYTEILTNELQGEAREAGRMLAQKLCEECFIRARPFCFIAGGETTVTIHGNGKGGRNQELALSAVETLSGIENVMLISLATDGDDGPTDAAGAVVTGETARKAKLFGLDAARHLSHNDAYPFFEKLGDLLKPGPTGTNVNDLVFLISI